jgi:hypothetical protein
VDGTSVVILGLMLIAGVGTVYAQSNAPADSHHPPATTPVPPPGGTPEPRAGNMMPTMDMCRQMMARSMMGMSADQPMDPKMMGHMLEMRAKR